MGRIKIGAIVLLSIAILVVVLQNTESVETKLLFVTVEMPRAVLIGVTFVVGGICGLLLASRMNRKAAAKKAAAEAPTA